MTLTNQHNANHPPQNGLHNPATLSASAGLLSRTRGGRATYGYANGAKRSLQVLLKIADSLGLSAEETISLARAFTQQVATISREDNFLDRAMAAALHSCASSTPNGPPAPADDNLATATQPQPVGASEPKRCGGIRRRNPVTVAITAQGAHGRAQ